MSSNGTESTASASLATATAPSPLATISDEELASQFDALYHRQSPTPALLRVRSSSPLQPIIIRLLIIFIFLIFVFVC
jgi:hypothetical protein